MDKPTVVSNPSPNRNGYGSPHEPRCVVFHITAGSGASALSWLTNPASQASSNYVITEDGVVHELVPPTESAWANGAVNKPNMANPIVAATINAGRNMNTVSVSIEHAGQSSMGQGGSLTAAQIDATIRLTAWLCSRFGIKPDRQHIIPHSFVDSVNRANCPGFSNLEFDTWVGKIAALVGGQQPASPPVASGEGVYPSINAKGEAELLINFSGVATGIEGVDIQDVGITVVNAAGERYARSVQGNTFGDWHKIG